MYRTTQSVVSSKQPANESRKRVGAAGAPWQCSRRRRSLLLEEEAGPSRIVHLTNLVTLWSDVGARKWQRLAALLDKSTADGERTARTPRIRHTPNSPSAGRQKRPRAPCLRSNTVRLLKTFRHVIGLLGGGSRGGHLEGTRGTECTSQRVGKNQRCTCRFAGSVGFCPRPARYIMYPSVLPP
jgi:hypothetical protein